MIICLIVLGMVGIALVRHILYFIYHSRYEKYNKLEDSLGYIAYGDTTSDRAIKKNLYRKRRTKYRTLENNLAFDGEFSCFKSVVCSFNAVSGFILLIGISLILIISHSPRQIMRNVELLNMDKQSIEYRLEQLETIDNSSLYLYKDAIQDANEFNKKIYGYKWKYNNPWVNWFIPKAYTQIEQIKYAEVIESTKSNIKEES